MYYEQTSTYHTIIRHISKMSRQTQLVMRVCKWMSWLESCWNSVAIDGTKCWSSKSITGNERGFANFQFLSMVAKQVSACCKCLARQPIDSPPLTLIAMWPHPQKRVAKSFCCLLSHRKMIVSATYIHCELLWLCISAHIRRSFVLPAVQPARYHTFSTMFWPKNSWLLY